MAMHDIHTEWHGGSAPETSSADRWAMRMGVALIASVLGLALFGIANDINPDMKGGTGSDDWHGNVAASGWES